MMLNASIESTSHLKRVFAPKPPPKLQWVEHNCERIMVHSYAHAPIEQVPQMIREYGKATQATGLRELRILLDSTGAYVNRDVLAAFKREGTRLAARVCKVAVIGASGVQHFFLRLVTTATGIDGRSFATREEALDWLAE